jgi:hypothetical protein
VGLPSFLPQVPPDAPEEAEELCILTSLWDSEAPHYSRVGLKCWKIIFKELVANLEMLI